MSTELLTNLLKGYLAATDKVFVAYIDKKIEAYEESPSVTADEMMLWARQKYYLLRDKGLWNASTQEEEKILALTAQIKQIENKWKNKKQGSPNGGSSKGQKDSLRKE